MTHQVALLDIDICGPSVPHLMGVASASIKQSPLGWIPVYPVTHAPTFPPKYHFSYQICDQVENIAVVSVGFLLDDPNAAVRMRTFHSLMLFVTLLPKRSSGEDQRRMVSSNNFSKMLTGARYIRHA